ncbi:hypothetical protein [Desulfotalea psychrophila]|uniref:Uncharacterized protein n=1 Tax=Desulfotalea psychrophila (strain LSv54 / DSM 12343) TaxID=177439 RepID=Q6APE6_DESPS|nr:hypothetical protein [Desulfotalea psychrophila]CAG35778.1 unknown protein [Desulfotalea psychrophila LSv54]
MKIFIGITQNQEEIQRLLTYQGGTKDSLTELGPFLSQEDALLWLNHLKEKIRNLEELSSMENTSKDGGWYGFTFEQI